MKQAPKIAHISSVRWAAALRPPHETEGRAVEPRKRHERWSDGGGWIKDKHPLRTGPSRAAMRAETTLLVAEYHARKRAEQEARKAITKTL